MPRTCWSASTARPVVMHMCASLAPDGTEVESKPDWLDVAIDKQNGAETIYSFTLNDRDITGVPEDKGTVTFRNKKQAI